MRKTEPEHDSLKVMITIEKIMEILDCGRDKAKKIMKTPQLHSYFIGDTEYCDFEDWEQYRRDLRTTGGVPDASMSMRMLTQIDDTLGDGMLYVAEPIITADALKSAFDLSDDETKDFFNVVSDEGTLYLKSWHQFLKDLITVPECTNKAIQIEDVLNEIFDCPPEVYENDPELIRHPILEQLVPILSDDTIRRIIEYAKEKCKGTERG